jgi:hypothetical protein
MLVRRVVSMIGGWQYLPSSSANDGHLLAGLDVQREVLNDWFIGSDELAVCKRHIVGGDLPMECSDVVEFNLARTRPSSRWDVIFSILVFRYRRRGEVLYPRHATNMRL